MCGLGRPLLVTPPLRREPRGPAAILAAVSGLAAALGWLLGRLTATLADLDDTLARGSDSMLTSCATDRCAVSNPAAGC